MTTIYKYEIKGTRAEIELPFGATILRVDEQHGRIMLWAMVDTSAPKEVRVFEVFGTGSELPFENRRFINTFLIQGGVYVFHAFEVLPAKHGEK